MARSKSATTIPAPLARLAGRAAAAADFLRILSNEHRLRVLCLLRDAESSVGEMNALIDVSQSVLSQHLAVLREHKLVRTRRCAQTIYYSLAPGPVSAVIDALHDTLCRHVKRPDHAAAAVAARAPQPAAARRPAA